MRNFIPILKPIHAQPKQLLLTTIFLIGSIGMISARHLQVIDSLERTPIQGATVIGNSGLILGITDMDGRIEDPHSRQYPLSIRNIGYDPVTLTSFVDTVRLSPAVYTLNEFVVSSDERPIKRVVIFAREYATGAISTDTLQLYSEYMMESFLKDDDKKVKSFKKGDAYPKIKNVRRYARFANNEGLDSIARPKAYDDITMLSWSQLIDIPNFKFTDRGAINTGAVADTIMGKSGPANIHRKHSGIYTITADNLAVYKDHKWSPFFFKLLGMTMDVEQMLTSYAYKTNQEGRYSLEDFISGTHSIHVLGRGKIIKWIFRSDTPIEMDAYIEFYPVSITYLTPEEYKESRSEKDDLPFEMPDNLPSLPESVSRLIERFNPSAK